MLVLALAVAAALFSSRASLFSSDPGLQLEDVPDAAPAGAGSAYLGDLQVAGVRTLYTADYKPKVRAVIINHGEVPRSGINVQVHLWPVEAPSTAPPLASFSIAIDGELAPQEARDIETDLTAMGTLASFPKWNKLRLELEAP